MKILQLDVNSIAYKLVKPEASVYDDAKVKEDEVKDALAVFVAIESGDTEKIADQAIDSCIEFAKKQKLQRIMLYPFAHLSDNLEEPSKAIKVFKHMREHAAESFKGDVSYAPFGWNKQLSIDIKGHPLAEQSRSYGSNEGVKAKKVERKKVNLSIVKKSDWAGLPETDHRTIGERLDLYSFQEVSPSMTYWHPNGSIIFRELFKYIREKLEEYGYQEIATPAFANIALWHVSGHNEHYKDNMFLLEVDGQEFGLKPMNCPSTFLVYKAKKWSYRDFPVRFADFDKLYRKEVSGSLTGLFRVMEITQDDAHLFVTEDQVESELTMVLKMIDELYKKFGLDYKVKLSTMPDDHAGDKGIWDKATSQLANVLNKNKIKFELKEKEGAFYGPKIDFDIKDSTGREWQCGTIQLDYQLPTRFNLQYTGEDGKDHTPVVIHRVIYGSLERFLGVITEHYQGKFPTWLAPIQAIVMSIGEDNAKYAEEVYKKLKSNKIRAKLDISDRTLEYKIREAQGKKVPYMIVLGKREQESKKITVRDRQGKQKQNLDLQEFISTISGEIEKRSSEQAY